MKPFRRMMLMALIGRQPHKALSISAAALISQSRTAELGGPLGTKALGERVVKLVRSSAPPRWAGCVRCAQSSAEKFLAGPHEAPSCCFALARQVLPVQAPVSRPAGAARAAPLRRPPGFCNRLATHHRLDARLHAGRDSKRTSSR